MNTKYRGFTLIEMLVVISIIGILAAVVMTSYSGAQKQARDKERQSDLSQYRVALENYATNSAASTFPNKNGHAATVLCVNPNNLSPTYIASCPEDPRNTDDAANYYYTYNSDGTSYVLSANLENGNFWVICSNGRSDSAAARPGSAVCPL